MWLERAEQGDPAAQYQLGYCCEQGLGTPVDLEAATRWYARAARQGHGRAQYHLGLAYAYGGAGLPWDLAAACQWLSLAARNHIREAAAALDLLKATPDQRARGERDARAFTPQPEAPTNAAPAPGTTLTRSALPRHAPEGAPGPAVQIEWDWGGS